MAGKFEVYPLGTQWRFRHKSGNGEIVATGEAYSSKDGWIAAAKLCKTAAAGATILEVDR
jgi:uncharacterized protein YegP (UPF0339 family)